MKKIGKLVILTFICSLCMLGVTEASAKEAYFTNNNGVSLTKEEYDFFAEMYWDGFQDIMTQKQYNIFNDGGYFGHEIESKTVYDTPLTRGTEHSTANKSITISKVCNSDCAITVYVKWINNPAIRSYDVIGAYLYNVSRTGVLDTFATATGGTANAAGTKTQTKGFGTSIKIPSGSNLRVTQTFTTTKGGHIYASYQHAAKESSLAISQQFDISVAGFGSVFEFYGDAYNIYDRMNGVDIAV